MKTDNIRIKRKNSDFLLYGFLYLLLMIVGIFLTGLPFLSFAPNGSGARIFLTVLGVLCIGAGGTLYGMLLYRGLCPLDALVITNKGLTDHLVGGREGVYIEWTNVSSMKIYGLSKSPMLGLSLENNESYLSHLSGRDERLARSNLDVGMPIVSIAQRDVFLPIGELKNLFSRMIKGAISWENYSTQGKKPSKPTEPQTAPSETPKQVRTKPVDPQPDFSQPDFSQPTFAQPDFSQPDFLKQAFTLSDLSQPTFAQPDFSQPEPQQSSADEFRPIRTQDAPTRSFSPVEPPKDEFLFETLSDDEITLPSEPPVQPAKPKNNDSQEEIVLLDIDND